jgi:hypothetical protein
MNQKRPLFALLTFGAVLTFPLFLSGCAQFSQLMGTPAESTEAAQSAPAQDPASQATVTAPPTVPASPQSTGTTGPETKPAKKAVGTPSPKASPGQASHTPSSAASQQVSPAATAQPAGPDSKQDRDKAVAEKEQPAKSKKSSKKSSKPEAKPQPEDAFLPPVPLPSKPAAIGGSGG